MPKLLQGQEHVECKKCGALKHVSECYIDSGGYVSYCKACKREYQKLWRATRSPTKKEFECKHCGKRVLGRLYCSKACENEFRKAMKRKGLARTPCRCCGVEFQKISNNHVFCSQECKGLYKYKSGRVTTATQYERLSASWDAYFARLVCQKGRKGQITTAQCLEILERQNYRCALSGVLLTKNMKRGTVCPSNASLDRIIAGGSYKPENVQLVCLAVNQWRNAQKLEHFIWWCKQVAATQPEEKSECPV